MINIKQTIKETGKSEIISQDEFMFRYGWNMIQKTNGLGKILLGEKLNTEHCTYEEVK